MCQYLFTLLCQAFEWQRTARKGTRGGLFSWCSWWNYRVCYVNSNKNPLFFLTNNNNNNLPYFDSLSGNKGLCGVPSLPSCPLLWENGHLSKGGKIAIAISCLVIFLVLLLVIYLCCIWRGRHDYDFAPPHDLTCESKKKKSSYVPEEDLNTFLNLDPFLSCSACSKEKQIPETKVANATGNGESTRQRNAHTSTEFAIVEKERSNEIFTWKREQGDEMR